MVILIDFLLFLLSGRFLFQELPVVFLLFVGKEIHLLESVIEGKLPGSLADQHDVNGFFHHFPRD